ncbi:MAG TPA: hypothetical protein VGH87_25805 [Polyangiaceae bacterium]|jgi:hypothetical protein
MTLPLWAIGLVLAGAAPFIVRVIADALEARAKRRTEDFVAQAKKSERGELEGRSPSNENDMIKKS